MLNPVLCSLFVLRDVDPSISVCLFLITNTFMPVARIILRQFECRCDGLGELNSGLWGDAVSPDTCYSAIDTARRCFPTHTSLTQIVAFIVGTLYLVGIPIFYYKLIHETVSLVLSTSRQYKLLSIEIDRLESLSKQERALFAGEIKEYKRIQFKLVRYRTDTLCSSSRLHLPASNLHLSACPAGIFSLFFFFCCSV